MRKLLCIFVLTATMFAGDIVTGVRTTVPAPPVPPLFGYFHQWQRTFMQWGLKEGPYASVEASVDPRRTPTLIDFCLQERESGKRIHFVTDKALQEEYRNVATDAYLSSVSYKKTNNSDGFDVHEFSLRDHKGRSVVWRFVQATPPSEKGAGLTEILAGKPLILMYRLGGSVAAQDTAIQIDKLVQQADVWQEISQPPYFIAYKGAMTEGALLGEISMGSLEWTVQSAPKSLEAGESWKLKDQSGLLQELKISSFKGNEGLFTLAREVYGKVQPVAEVQATLTEGRWLLHQIRYCDDDQAMTIKLEPGMYLTGTGDVKNLKFQIVMAKNQKVAEGIVDTAVLNGTDKEFTWRLRAPGWAKKKVLVETFHSGPTSSRVDSTPGLEAH